MSSSHGICPGKLLSLVSVCVPCSLFGKPFDGGKRMDHGVPQPQGQAPMQQQQPSFMPQHPAMTRLYDVHREVASLGPQVCTFSGLQNDRDYRRLERELARLQLEVDQVSTVAWEPGKNNRIYDDPLKCSNIFECISLLFVHSIFQVKT